jgi:hypothetical protein
MIHLCLSYAGTGDLFLYWGVLVNLRVDSWGHHESPGEQNRDFDKRSLLTIPFHCTSFFIRYFGDCPKARKEVVKMDVGQSANYLTTIFFTNFGTITGKSVIMGV